MPFTHATERSSDRFAPTLHVGDLIPDVWADSTIGPLRLHQMARGTFTLLLFHPGAYLPESKTELVDFALASAEFESRGVQIIGLSQSDAVTERMWLDEIAERVGVRVPFPIIADEAGRVAAACGMHHETERMLLPLRRSVVIGPTLKVRALWDYPSEVARSAAEALRVVDALRRRHAVMA